MPKGQAVKSAVRRGAMLSLMAASAAERGLAGRFDSVINSRQPRRISERESAGKKRAFGRAGSRRTLSSRDSDNAVKKKVSIMWRKKYLNDADRKITALATADVLQKIAEPEKYLTCEDIDRARKDINQYRKNNPVTPLSKEAIEIYRNIDFRIFKKCIARFFKDPKLREVLDRIKGEIG